MFNYSSLVTGELLASSIQLTDFQPPLSTELCCQERNICIEQHCINSHIHLLMTLSGSGSHRNWTVHWRWTGFFRFAVSQQLLLLFLWHGGGFTPQITGNPACRNTLSV